MIGVMNVLVVMPCYNLSARRQTPAAKSRGATSKWLLRYFTETLCLGIYGQYEKCLREAALAVPSADGVRSKSWRIRFSWPSLSPGFSPALCRPNGRLFKWSYLRPVTPSMNAKGSILMRSLACQYASSGRKETCSILTLKQPSCVHEIILILCLMLGGPAYLRAAQGISPKTLELAYTARVERPTTHIVSIEIVARQVQSPALDFVIPAWAPGRY